LAPHLREIANECTNTGDLLSEKMLSKYIESKEGTPLPEPDGDWEEFTKKLLG